jgi:hypothetical protein
MDKLERYLDQVCRSIGGPRSLRQHIRQELREHLRDAVAEYQAAGLSEQEAIARALEHFGGSEQLRTELEATHGQRLMAVVIDKAIDWKERTMKAKWLWLSWAHVALGSVVVLQVLFLTFAQIFLVPRFRRIVQDTGFNMASYESWIPSFLQVLDWLANNTTWCLLAVALAWGLFEWRLRSENKALIRLSALGTAAFGLMIMIVLLAATLIIPLMLVIPEIQKTAHAGGA